MVVPKSYLAQQIREGMDHYWSVVYSKTDVGLSAVELGWKQDHDATMHRWSEKYGVEFDRIFGKAK